MFRVFFIWAACLSLLSAGRELCGQTYTFDIANSADCDGQWNTSECWSWSAGPDCDNNPVGVPDNDPLFNRCEVDIIIQGAVTFPGDLILQGNLGAITIGEFGALTVAGNVIIESQNEIGIFINGGDLQVEGQLLLENGHANGPLTILNVAVSNGGSFEVQHVNGPEEALVIGNRALLNIDGDSGETSTLWVPSIDIGQGAQINIYQGGGLIVEGPTEFSGNNSSINVEGFFRTGGVLITGGAGNQLNTYGSAEVVIDNDLDVRGNSQITFGGTSEVDIGRDIVVEGGSQVIAAESAKVFVCGDFPDPSESDRTVELEEGRFFATCRILPVEWADVQAEWKENLNLVKLRWSTVREWESGYFDVERSINGVDGFEIIDRLDAQGWSDHITHYVYEDRKLPVDQGKIYYRIRLSDINGDESFSKIVAVSLGRDFPKHNSWYIYPNPSAGRPISVALRDNGAYDGENIGFRLFSAVNSSDQVVVSSMEQLSLAVNEVLKTFSKGLVILEVGWNGHVQHVKFIY